MYYQITDHTSASQRALGAYYTPTSVADFIANWAVRADDEHILEPSFGDGSFINAMAHVALAKGLSRLRLTGIEINGATLTKAPLLYPVVKTSLYHADFLAFVPTSAQAVVGNPPYVRLRHLPADQSKRAMQSAQMIGQKMDPAGSIWMPFLLHATRFLTPGGRLAFVLPYDFTYVRYARSLWAFLGQKFGSLRVIRTHERLFSDIYQEVILFLADDFGGITQSVSFDGYETVSALLTGNPLFEETLSLTDIVAGKRVFLQALLSPALRELLTGQLAGQLIPARRQLTFNIGYVSGDKDFFHPDLTTKASYELPEDSLLPAITSARMLRDVGLHTSNLATDQAARLFLPSPGTLTVGEKKYVAAGERQQVAARYKCRIRQPWYVVPGVRIPDLILSVFSERPLLLKNDAGYAASNSLLCGYCVPGTRDQVLAAWYTSLTLLQCELEVHALGGGVMVMVPGEAGNINLPRHILCSPQHLVAIDRELRAGRVETAYQLGDEAVLCQQLGLTPADIALIRQGVKTLAYWRTSARSPSAVVE